ncbi:Unconventional prefoldin RPB5 interactor [Trichoplax sp. H2]|nr:Unconventional prefoldin RPB5 interactor [Trichoplax sp. H2]|eukprot:RDD43043.1 Unconventional prefoldin RPB5 interactor [Trichoplax sp. H2]
MEENKAKHSDLSLAGVQRLQEEQAKEAEDCQQNIQQCKKLISDYEDLQSTLETLPYKRSYDIMVPFCGELAFFPGNLVHTNEVTALIGDNWFADVSAKEAQDIANRRKLELNETLSKLEQQRQNLSERLKLNSEFERDLVEKDGDGVIEIKEELTEKDEDLLYPVKRISRLKSNENTKGNISTANEKTKVNTSTSSIETDDAYWDRLEKLEAENEELSDEFTSQYDMQDDTTIRFHHSQKTPKENVPSLVQEISSHSSIERPDQVQKLISQGSHTANESKIVNTATKSFTGEIVEKQSPTTKPAPVTAKTIEKSSTPVSSEPQEASKPVSRFRAQRMKSGK